VSASAVRRPYPSVTKPAQSEAVHIPPNIEFRDPGAAARSLKRLRGRISTSVFEAFVPFLSASPNPDSVVVQFERLMEAAPAEVVGLFERQPILIHYAALVFGHSAWLGDTLIQNVDLFRRYSRNQGLDRSYSRDEFRDEYARTRLRASDPDLALSLARFRKREYVRILLRDVLGIAKLAETTEEISCLSDALIEEAVTAVNAGLQHQYGTPQWVDAQGRLRDSRFAVLSLGKLGGNELNYSSDIDLMFLYDGGVEPSSASISNREYFIRLAQQTTELLSRHTREGQVFRIDLRLRPQGHEGELAVALPRAVQYYSEVAQDWELQAMIKARHSAGDPLLAREFIRALEPFVYRRNVNFAAVKTALQTRERIDKRGKRSAPGRASQRAIDIKLDRGGIRDIEFLAQCLQRVYGGDEGWLRSRGTLFALQKLHDKEHISGKDYNNLNTAYEFLRHLEHRLQLRQGQQSHKLPHSQTELNTLAKCLDLEGSAALSSDQFVSQVQARMATVADIYRRVVYHEQSHQFIDAGGNLHLQAQVPPTAENCYSQIMQRLAVDAPRLLSAIGSADLSQHARRNLDRFFSSATTSSERYAAVLRSPAAVEHALTIFEESDYLTEILVRHPTEVALLDEVKGPAANASALLIDIPPDQGATVSDPVLAYLSQSNVERQEALALVRQQFRHSLFVSGARDLYRCRCVFESFEENTNAADRALQSALAIADPPPGFAVMAVGRLGSREFDLLSDADLLFVADETCDRGHARRAAERIVESLTAYTRDGTVFPVDTRLRPQGREGELVTTPARLASYFQRDAQPWEAITFLRLRLAAGEIAVGEQAIAVVQKGIAAIAQRPEFDPELAEMRQRLEASDPDPNLKTGPGGTYDIDFFTGRLQAKHQVWAGGNLMERLSLLRRRQLLGEAEFQTLCWVADLLRSLEHFMRLVTGRPGKWLRVAKHADVSVAKLMARMAGYDKSRSLDDILAEATARMRAIYLNHRF
jgi:[glutamine synthetase] adenylyltransferase / [glutamine synthetase]-adenylyl-L-tyrosine phosphorylase